MDPMETANHFFHTAYGTITTPPTIPIFDRASHHFVANFVIKPPPRLQHGVYEYLLSMLNNKPGAHFTAAYEAVSLASIANTMGCADILEKRALAKYTSALALVSRAIQDPTVCLQDDTVVAVLLLGIYEILSNIQLGFMSWGTHVEGAVQLIKRRGSQQFLLQQGRNIFVDVRMHQVAYIYRTGRPPLMDISSWTHNDDTEMTDPIRLTLKVGNMRSEISKLIPQLSSKNTHIFKQKMTECIELEQECLYWMRAAPAQIAPHYIQWDYPVLNNNYCEAEIFPGKLSHFEGAIAAGNWATICAARAVLSALIIRLAASISGHASYKSTPEYHKYLSTSKEMVQELVSLIPFQLGWFNRHQNLLNTPLIDKFACGQDDVPKSIGGYYMLWSLGVIRMYDASTDNQRQWAIGRLNYVGDVLGIRAAKAVTKVTLRIPSMLIYQDQMRHKRNNESTFGLESLFSSAPDGPSPTDLLS